MKQNVESNKMRDNVLRQSHNVLRQFRSLYVCKINCLFYLHQIFSCFILDTSCIFTERCLSTKTSFQIETIKTPGKNLVVTFLSLHTY